MTNPWLRDDASTKSWGAPQLRIASPASSTVTWGTLSTSTSSSNSSLQAAIDHKTSWSPPTNTFVGPHQGWASNASPPLYSSPSPYPSPSLYPSPSSALGNPPSIGTYGGYPSPSPISSPAGSWNQLNPMLDSRSPHCLIFDVGSFHYMPNMNESAVHPPVTFMQVLIIVQPFKWSVNIQVPAGPVSVSQVVQQIYEFLQGYNHNPQDVQKSKMVPSAYGHSQSDRFREQNHPNGFHSGQKRIDLLCQHRVFRGLSPEPGHKCAWVVHLSDR